MRFLVDAQLPRNLVGSLTKTGHDVIHTLDLPEKNRTSDHVITVIADEEERVVVTKEADFVNSFLLHRYPKKLLLISTGNISNRDLETVVLKYLPDAVRALNSHDFVDGEGDPFHSCLRGCLNILLLAGSQALENCERAIGLRFTACCASLHANRHSPHPCLRITRIVCPHGCRK